MPHKVDVSAAGKIVRVLRAPDQKSPMRSRACRVQKKCLQGRLPVGRVIAEIGQVCAIRVARFRRAMAVGVDMAVKGRHAPSTEVAPQRLERAAAGITEDQIKVRKSTRTNIEIHLAPGMAR